MSGNDSSASAGLLRFRWRFQPYHGTETERSKQVDASLHLQRQCIPNLWVDGVLHELVRRNSERQALNTIDCFSHPSYLLSYGGSKPNLRGSGGCSCSSGCACLSAYPTTHTSRTTPLRKRFCPFTCRNKESGDLLQALRICRVVRVCIVWGGGGRLGAGEDQHCLQNDVSIGSRSALSHARENVFAAEPSGVAWFWLRKAQGVNLFLHRRVVFLSGCQQMFPLEKSKDRLFVAFPLPTTS